MPVTLQLQPEIESVTGAWADLPKLLDDGCARPVADRLRAGLR